MKESKLYRLLLMIIAVCFCFFSSCVGENESTDKLWIVTDFNAKDSTMGSSYRNQENVLFPEIIEYLTGISREKLQLEFLPEDNDELAARLSTLRTQIMAGKGPDVFVLTADLPGLRDDERYHKSRDDCFDVYQKTDKLFHNISDAMERDIFLPLDSILQDGTYFDGDLINQPVLDAGKTEKGQMILPLTFTFPCAVYMDNLVDVQDCNPNNLEGAICQSPAAVQNAYRAAAQSQISDLLGEYVDYTNDKLLISKKELVEFVRFNLPSDGRLLLEELIQNPPFPADTFDGLLSVTPIEYYRLPNWDMEYYDLHWQPEDGSQLCRNIRNIDGDVVAAITSYACINRNTQHPEEALRLLDALFSIEVQSGLGCVGSTGEDGYQTFFLAACYGIPVRNDLLQSPKLSFNQRYFLSSGAFSEYTALRNEVTHARFYGTLDQELQTMYEACLEAESDEEIEKIVSKAYDTMLMILAES